MMSIERIDPEGQLTEDERISGAWKGLVIIGPWVAILVWATVQAGIWAATLADPSWLIAGAWVFFAIACITTLGWIRYRARESR